MTKERAKLQFDLDEPSVAEFPSIPPAKIKEATRAAGFLETPRRPEDPADDLPRRRARRKTGRVHQFATRLSDSTIKKIYGYADRHDITLAEAVEHAFKALEMRENAER